MERKSGRVVLQELGFGDDVWLFRNYILPGKLDAARKSLVGQWHYSPRRVEEINNGWHSTEAKSAEQALRSGDVEALINTWENDSYSHYRQEKSVWNLYLLAQLPREMALTFWLRINEKSIYSRVRTIFSVSSGWIHYLACYWLFTSSKRNISVNFKFRRNRTGPARCPRLATFRGAA